MNHRGLLEVSFRLMGLYVLVQIILLLPGVLSPLYRLSTDGLSGPLTRQLLFYHFLPISILLPCALLLFFGSGRLAMLCASSVVGDGLVANASHIQATAFSAAGVLVFSLAVPDVTSALMLILATGTTASEPSRGNLMTSHYSRFLGALLQAMLGIALFFKGPRLARFWTARAFPPVPHEPTVAAREESL